MSTSPAHSPSSRSSRVSLIFVFILFGWGCINIVQALLTEIEDDEAYYWMYSRFLDWGYFDHPPMIALFVKIGSQFFSGEFGVRFVTVIAQMVTLLLIWLIIAEKSITTKKIILFFGLAASIVMFQVYGFIATPDSPLLLFTALFLFAYQRFLEKESPGAILLLALSMAAMVYSKYHGALVILFIIASNPRLLLSRRFWIAGLLALILFTPHILWQIQNDYPSLRYHLVTRSRPVNIKHILNYIPNQLFSFNPFFLGLVIIVLFRFKPADLFQRGLYFIIGGFLGFFFLTTLRGHVEPHWTIAASIAMIIVVYSRCMDIPAYTKYIGRILLPSILILIVLRIALMVDFLPGRLGKFHGKETWHKHMASIAGDTPVLFRNSYQRASVYTFYTGMPATTINGIYSRKTQYDLWPFEESFFGKEVLLVTNINDPMAIPYHFPDGKKIYLRRTEKFFAVQQLEIRYDLPPSSVMHAGDSLSMDIEVFNPYPYAINFHEPWFPVTFHVMFVKSGNDMTVVPATTIPAPDILAPGEKRRLRIRFEVPDICSRKYKFGITLQAGILQEAFNSMITPVYVSER